jgi:hypothetical protein
MKTEHNLTSKQYQILILLYRYRFLNRPQIQQMMNHKDKKRINSWLKGLKDKKIIGCIYTRELTANNSAAIYHLATKSRNILLNDDTTDARVLKRVYREKHRSKRLVNHSLLTADINLLLNQQLKEDEKLHFFTKVDLITHSYFPYKRPDGYIAIESLNETKRYFLEIIDPGTPRFMLRKQISSYMEYFDEDNWQKATNYPNPKLLFVCPDETLQSFFQRYSQQVLEEEMIDVDIYTTSMEQIQNYQPKTNVWWQVSAG